MHESGRLWILSNLIMQPNQEKVIDTFNAVLNEVMHYVKKLKKKTLAKKLVQVILNLVLKVKNRVWDDEPTPRPLITGG